jgi:hypothetical protein
MAQLSTESHYPAGALRVPAVFRNYDYVFPLCGELLIINVFFIGIQRAVCGTWYAASREPQAETSKFRMDSPRFRTPCP